MLLHLMLGCEAWLFQGCYLQRVLLSCIPRVAHHVHAHARPRPLLAARSYEHSCIVHAPLPQAAIVALRTCASRVQSAAAVATMSIQVRTRQVSTKGLEAPSDPVCRGHAGRLGIPVFARKCMSGGLLLLHNETRNPEKAAQASHKHHV